MLQEPRKTFWCLQERCKCPEKLFGVCGSPANVSANAGSLAQPAQTSRQMPGTSRSLRKRLGKCRGTCAACANVSVNAGSLAQPAQTSRQMPGYLRGLRKRLGECREPRKCLEKLFGVCGSPAGHFQKRFDPRVASVETLCRLYAFVEHTFSICVFDVVPPPKVDYNRYRSMLLS